VDYSALSANDLATTCFQSGDELAWAEFVRRFQPLIASVVVRVARQWGESSLQVADDLIQETYLKLCGGGLLALRNFKAIHDDAIYGYIKAFTANLVHDRFKLSRAQKRGGGVNVSSMDYELAGPAPAATETSVVSLERKLLLEKVAHCLQKVSSGPNAERDRRIFWLYYRVGLTASAIAALPTVELSTKGVETTILRLSRAIRQALTVRAQADPHGQPNLEGMSPEKSF
jgi:RNA polymerase sigma-70 factor, ECF subfamily